MSFSFNQSQQKASSFALGASEETSKPSSGPGFSRLTTPAPAATTNRVQGSIPGDRSSATSSAASPFVFSSNPATTTTAPTHSTATSSTPFATLTPGTTASAPAPSAGPSSSFLGGAQQQQPRHEQTARQRSRERRPAITVDLRKLYDNVIDEPAWLTDEDIRELLDQLNDDDEPVKAAIDTLIKVFGSCVFRDRLASFFAEHLSQPCFSPRSQQSSQEWGEWVAGRRKLALLPGWREVRVAEVEGAEDIKEGIPALARFLGLEEKLALQLLNFYQKDRLRRGFGHTIDTRDYHLDGFRERVRRFYYNQRIYFLQNVQELLRIQQDEAYFAPRLRQAVLGLRESLEPSGESLLIRLQGTFQRLCEAPVPKVEELLPDAMDHAGYPSSFWERHRGDWVKQNLMEQSELLLLLLLHLSTQATLSFRHWCQMLALWRQLRMGQLSTEKAYLAKKSSFAHHSYRISCLMALVAIQGLHLGHFLPATSYLHPFYEDLIHLQEPPSEIEALFHTLQDPARAQSLPRPELISVVLLFLSCFLHLAAPRLSGKLQPATQKFLERARDQQAIVTQRAAHVHLAKLTAVLLGEPGTTGTADDRVMDHWLHLGFHDRLRQLVDRGQRRMTTGPVREVCQLPLVEAVNGLLAACYTGLPQGPLPMHRSSAVTSKKLEFLIFLAASVYQGHPDLTASFWNAVGGWQRLRVEEKRSLVIRETHVFKDGPLEYLAQLAKEMQPLLFVHLLGSMVSDSTSMAMAASVLQNTPLYTVTFDENVLEEVGEQVFRVVGPYIDEETSIQLFPGLVGRLIGAEGGQLPQRLCWELSVWEGVLLQFEAFADAFGRCRILPLMNALGDLHMRAKEGQEMPQIGFNTIIDRCPALFAFGPCALRTEDIVRQLLRRGASDLFAYSICRVTMLLDQLTLLLSVDPQAASLVLPSCSDSTSDSIAARLPLLLVNTADTATAASCESSGVTPKATQALLDMQASVMSLLNCLLGPNATPEVQRSSVEALVRPVQRPGVGDSLPLILSWGFAAKRRQGGTLILTVTLLMKTLAHCIWSMTWPDKHTVVPPGFRDDVLVQIVDFAVCTFLQRESQPMSTPCDRYSLCKTCLELINGFLSCPFLEDEPSGGILEAHRSSLMRRFCDDTTLIASLLRCIEHLPAATLRELLDLRGQHRISLQFLDELHPGNTYGAGLGSHGLLFPRESVLPLAFEQARDLSKGHEDIKALEEMTKEGLRTLNFVLEYFTSNNGDEQPSGLRLLTERADVIISSPSHPLEQSLARHKAVVAGVRQPLITHITLLASLVLYQGRADAVQVATAAAETMKILLTFWSVMQGLHQVGGEEDSETVAGQVQLLSVTDARGFRRGLFEMLNRQTTRPEVVSAVLDMLVEMSKLQPELTKHVIFCRRRAERPGMVLGKRKVEDREDMLPETVLKQLLIRCKAFTSVAQERQSEAGVQGMLLAGVLRFFVTVIRSATPPRRMQILEGLDLDTWRLLAGLFTSVEIEDSKNLRMGQVQLYCLRLLSHAYLLQLTQVIGAEVVDMRRAGKQGEMRTKKVLEVLRLLLEGMTAVSGDERKFRVYLRVRFLPYFVARLLSVELPDSDRFRRSDWKLALVNAAPRRFTDAGLVYDLSGLRRYLHMSLLGSVLSAEGRLAVMRRLGVVDKYFSIAAAQYTLNEGFRGLAQLVMSHLRQEGGGKQVQALAGEARRLITDVSQEGVDSGLASADLALQALSVSPAAGIGNIGTESVLSGKQKAELVDVSRHFRRPRLELLLTIVCTYGQTYNKAAVAESLTLVEREFERLAIEGQDGSLAQNSGSEALELERRQCLLTIALLLLQTPAISAWSREGPLPQLAGALSYTLGSFTSLTQVAIGDDQDIAARVCRSERVETVLRTCLALLGTLFACTLPISATKDVDAALEQTKAEDYMVQELQQYRIIPLIFAYWSTAARVAARAFNTLHNRTATRGRESCEASSQHARQFAMPRLISIVAFLRQCVAHSSAFGQLLFKETIIQRVLEDPIIRDLLKVVHGSANDVGILSMRHGYYVSGQESQYHLYWTSLLGLVTLLLHRLIRPRHGSKAALTIPLGDRTGVTTRTGILTAAETQVVDQILAFSAELRPLLLYPLQGERILTLALLREAEEAMRWFKELALHGVTWRMADGKSLQEVRQVSRSLIVRMALVFGTALASSEDASILSVLGEAFQIVSPTEQNMLRPAAEGAAVNAGDLEVAVSDKLISILAAAMACLHWTSSTAATRRVILAPPAVQQVVLPEGSQVWYLDYDGQNMLEGIIQRRNRQTTSSASHLQLGSYDILCRDKQAVERGVQRERIVEMEDREALTAEVDVELDLSDSASEIPPYNQGRVSTAHLLACARYVLSRLRQLPRHSQQCTVPQNGEVCLTDLLRHTLLLLILAARGLCQRHKKGAAAFRIESMLKRFLDRFTELLWAAVLESSGLSARGGDSSGTNVEAVYSDVETDRIRAAKGRVDEVLARVRANKPLQELELEETLSLTVGCGRASSTITAEILQEMRHLKPKEKLCVYAACLRALALEGRIGALEEVLTRWVDDSLSTHLRHLRRCEV